MTASFIDYTRTGPGGGRQLSASVDRSDSGAAERRAKTDRRSDRWIRRRRPEQYGRYKSRGRASCEVAWAGGSGCGIVTSDLIMHLLAVAKIIEIGDTSKDRAQTITFRELFIDLKLNFIWTCSKDVSKIYKSLASIFLFHKNDDPLDSADEDLQECVVLHFGWTRETVSKVHSKPTKSLSGLRKRRQLKANTTYT